MPVDLLLLAACSGGVGGGVPPTPTPPTPTPAAADFTFAADSTAQPLPVGGTVTGDAEVEAGLTINRVRWASGVLRFNRAGAGSFSTWGGANPSATFTVEVDGSSVVRAVGDAILANGQIRWNITAAADVAVLDGIDPGDEVRVVVRTA